MLLAEHSIAGAVIANKRHAQQQARTKHSVGSADKRRERTPGFLTTSSCEKKHRKIDRSTFGQFALAVALLLTAKLIDWRTSGRLIYRSTEAFIRQSGSMYLLRRSNFIILEWTLRSDLRDADITKRFLANGQSRLLLPQSTQRLNPPNGHEPRAHAQIDQDLIEPTITQLISLAWAGTQTTGHGFNLNSNNKKKKTMRSIARCYSKVIR